jgi:hypothetical protein
MTDRVIVHRIRHPVALLLAALGCDARTAGRADLGPADASADAPLTCAQIQTQWSLIVDSLDRSCGNDEDCIAVGGSDSCDGATAIGDCGGVAVRAASYPTAAADLAAEYRSRCDDEGLVFDCLQGTAECASGMCRIADQCRCYCTDGGPVPSDGTSGN